MAKRSANVLSESEVENLLHSDSEQSLCESDSSVTSDRAFIDAVEYVDSDEDQSANEEFMWEDMESYRERRENVTGSVGPQGLAKDVTDIVELFELFFDKALIETIVTETNKYAEQSLHSCLYFVYVYCSKIILKCSLGKDYVYIYLCER
jgi:hypothetical protein